MSQQERSAEHLKAPFNATLIVPLPDPSPVIVTSGRASSQPSAVRRIALADRDATSTRPGGTLTWADVNGRHEGLNNKIRTMTRRVYGFNSPKAALALVMCTCRPITLTRPYDTGSHPHS